MSCFKELLDMAAKKAATRRVPPARKVVPPSDTSKAAGKEKQPLRKRARTDEALPESSSSKSTMNASSTNVDVTQNKPSLRLVATPLEKLLAPGSSPFCILKDNFTPNVIPKPRSDCMPWDAAGGAHAEEYRKFVDSASDDDLMLTSWRWASC